MVAPLGQSPFSQQVPAPIPRVIKPLHYCEFRVIQESRSDYNTAPDVVVCPVMASELIEEMYFCFNHGAIIQAALFAEGET